MEREWNEVNTPSHVTDVLVDVLLRAIVILHQRWTLAGTGGRRDRFLPPPGFLFSLIVDGDRLLNFCVSALLSEHLEVPPLGCHQIFSLSGLKPEASRHAFCYFFSKHYGFFCFELQDCLGLMISLSRFAHLWNSAALG